MGRHEEALKILHGGTVIPAIPLVLDENRKFNEAGQRTLIRYYLDAGVGGLAVAVHTTQFEIRKPEVGLFEPVLRVTKEEMDAYEARTGKTLVRVAGACGEAEQACAEARTAKALGFDAVLLSPGGLAHRTEEELVERTHAVAAEMPVIGFYLQTACGGRRLSYEYWKAVADTPGVVAIKCASFNRYQSIDLVRGVAYSARREEIALYTGNDDNIVADLLTPYRFPVDGKEVELRFVGGLLGHWSVWTHSVVKLYEELREYRDGRDIPAELLARGAAVTDCNGVFFDVAHNFAGCIPGVHEVLRRQGLMAGTWCLDPDETLSEGQAAGDRAACMRCTLISTTMRSLRRILKRGKRERTMNTMTDALKRAACAAIDAQAQRLTAFGRDILAHPELGYKETRTAGKVLEAFASLGLTDVTRPARTGVKGWLWRGAGPRVAVIGELDAVLSPGHPFADKATGAAHACGHNAQLASMLGCAVGLRAVADSLAGSVCLLAAPAEEYVEIGWRAGLRRAGEVQYLGGKQQLIAEGAFDDIDMAMMVHSETDAPQPRAVVAGAAGGFIGKELRFLGKEAHAGGAPWEGVNALNAASLAIAGHPRQP